MTTSTHATETPLDLAIRFLTNVYTDVEMSPDEWLAESTRETNVFATSGGLNAMVKQNTARAKQMGGFMAAVVRKSERSQTGYEATIRNSLQGPREGT